MSLFKGEALIKRLNQSSNQGSTITLTIDDTLYQSLRGHEGKHYAFVLQEIGNDGEKAATPPYEPPAFVPDKAKPVDKEKKERWNSLKPKAKWLIERCDDPMFWKYINLQNHVGANEARKIAKDWILNTLNIASRSEADLPQHSNNFNSLREHYSKYVLAMMERDEKRGSSAA